jgi:PDZ domain
MPRRYGAGYTAKIDAARHIVYVSAGDAATLARVMDMLGPYADAQRQYLFPQPLPWNMLVVLPTLADYRKDQPPGMPKAMGYYQLSTRTLQSISLSDILLHEFTHGLHHADQTRAGQRHPIWLTEGLATFYQGTRWRDRAWLEPVLDPGVALVQEKLRQKKAHPLAELLTITPAAFLADEKLCYAESRYLVFYLHNMGKLKTFYEAYKADYAKDPSGAAAMVAVLGKPLPEIEADWQAWVLAQKPPWTPANPPHTNLGVRMEAAENGVRITGFVRGSAAERGGVLKEGDIVLSVAGQATPAATDLTAAVQACKPGEIVDVEVIRDGKMATVRQMLGAVRP